MWWQFYMEKGVLVFHCLFLSMSIAFAHNSGTIILSHFNTMHIYNCTHFRVHRIKIANHHQRHHHQYHHQQLLSAENLIAISHSSLVLVFFFFHLSLLQVFAHQKFVLIFPFIFFVLHSFCIFGSFVAICSYISVAFFCVQ